VSNLDNLDEMTRQQLETLAGWMRGKKTVLVTGAGMSTDTGIPDYRGKGNTEIPSVEYDQFVSDPVWQRWVWARNHQTWQTMLSLDPAPAHLAQARLERAGLLTGIATQNVDGLDLKAGCEEVYEMHGSFGRVECVDCGEITDRQALHERLTEANPDYPLDLDPAHVAILAVADRKAAEACTFKTVPCERCGGLLKPAVVFFGQLLPAEVMSRAYAAAAKADVVVVVGSSLVVGTATYVMQAGLAKGAPLAIINRGRTMYDRAADLRIEGGASPCLTALADLLGA